VILPVQPVVPVAVVVLIPEVDKYMPVAAALPDKVMPVDQRLVTIVVHVAVAAVLAALVPVCHHLLAA
jgi:hypothetical protein